ncbi:MAG: VanW family protein [Lachnospiraceae bacterium]
MPGDVVSVHDITSPYDAYGYALAGSYENGQVVDSYGGGICQYLRHCIMPFCMRN